MGPFFISALFPLTRIFARIEQWEWANQNGNFLHCYQSLARLQQITLPLPVHDLGKPQKAMTVSSQLKDPSLFTERCFADGEWIGAENASTFPVDNPATGAIIGNVPACGRLA